jgi:hypothetical protein
VSTTGRVMTVRGPVSEAELGVTLPHEHVMCDMARSMYVPHPDARQRAAAERPITLDELWRVRERPLEQRDNLSLTEEDVAARELDHFRAAGGGTVVDCTVRGLYPDPAALARLSRATGVHIVLGTGYYVARTHSAGMDDKTVEEIADEFVGDLTEGIEGTGVRAGLIGELGIGGLTAFEGISSFAEVGPNEPSFEPAWPSLSIRRARGFAACRARGWRVERLTCSIGTGCRPIVSWSATSTGVGTKIFACIARLPSADRMSNTTSGGGTTSIGPHGGTDFSTTRGGSSWS